MRRVFLFAATSVVVALAVGGAPAPERARAAGASGRMVEVLVVLKAQENVSAIRATKRQARVVAVVQALRARAAAGQRDLRVLLRRRKAEGEVAKIVPLWILNAIEVKATPAVLEELAGRPEVQEIRPNISIEAPVSTATTTSPEANIALVNAPALWSLGVRGQGIVVANMDTGVDASHPDLAARWRGGGNSWYDPNGQHPTTPTDVDGHGTATMGVMVGGDAGGTSVGMAPDAKWIAVKIFNDQGTATAAGIHLGFQWLLDPDGDPSTADAPNVVNNSWTMSVNCSSEFQLDLQNLRAAGILSVFAAGNYGPGSSTGKSPADNPEAFAVGATDDADALAAESSRGPSTCDQSVYPELVAPGVDVHTTDLYGLYIDATGTSLSAPHVGGALALLLSAFPNITADRQEAALESGAVDLGAGGPDNDFGFGRLDVLAAYDWLLASPDFTVSASPPSVSAVAGGTVPYEVSVNATGGFSGDVALELGGLSPSQASWTFSPPVVAGGAGSSQLELTLAADLAPGSYPLTITGTSGSTTRSSSVTLVVSGPPDFTLAASPASSSVVAGAAASYTVSVASLNGFAGDVALSVSGLPAGTSSAFSPALLSTAGTAQLTVSTTSSAVPGTYPLVVSGSSGATFHSANVALVITPAPDFALAASPASSSVVAGATASYTVSVASLNGFAGDVALSVSGLPAGTSSAFSPALLSTAGTAQLTVSTTSSAVPGTYPLVVSGSSGATFHSANVALVITPAPDFALSVSPKTRTVYRGQSTYYTVSVASMGGFHGRVTLSVSGKPSRATTSFSRNPVTAPGTSRLTIRIATTTPRAIYKLRITGTSGMLKHSVTTTLVVR